MWRYPDLGPHVIFLANVIYQTPTKTMPEEFRFLRDYGEARAALKEVVEMPDHQADQVLRSIEANHGKLRNVLVKEMPIKA